MLYKSIIVKDRTGKEIELRNAVVQDAEALIEYLKKTNAESLNPILDAAAELIYPEQTLSEPG